MSVKKVLKKIFPIVFLKKLFIIYNRTKIKTFDRIFFPEYFPNSTEVILYQKLYPFKENKVSIDGIRNEKVKKYMSEWYEWTQEEFIVKINKESIIEPDYGWNLINGQLNFYSLGLSRTPFQPKPNYLRLIRNKKFIELDKVISLRDTGEENYFHFYNDVLAKLFFLRDHGVNLNEYTILISHKIWEKKYFKYFYNASLFLKNLKWHVQKDEYIRAKEALFGKPLTHRKNYFDGILDQISISPLHEESKIYLKRNRNRLRYIENEEEVEKIFEEMNFNIVDADSLSSEEQIKLFSKAKWLVGIHGAGLTNIIFRHGHDMKLLEIFPPPSEGYLPFHYIMLADMYGFEYQALIGQRSKNKYSGGFYLDPFDLKENLLKLLNANRI